MVGRHRDRDVYKSVAADWRAAGAGSFAAVGASGHGLSLPVYDARRQAVGYWLVAGHLQLLPRHSNFTNKNFTLTQK
jgi:hypothetical protein